MKYFNDDLPIPDRCMLITFDDAYDDILTVAHPLLEKYEFPGVLFVNTDAVGKFNEWNPKAQYKKRHLDWNELSFLESNNFEIGGHSCSHRSFLKLEKKEIDYELRACKELIEDKLNVNVNSFSYPYGDFNTTALELVFEIYDIAFSVEQYSHVFGDLLYRIPRISMTNRQSPTLFRAALEINLWTLAEFRTIL